MIRNVKNKSYYLFIVLVTVAILGLWINSRLDEGLLEVKSLITVIDDESLPVEETLKKNHNYFMILEIRSINFRRGLYKVDDPRNQVNQNPQILKESDLPDVTGGLLMIAAHSGNSAVSYFKKLDRIQIEDLIYIYYQNQKYIYKVTDIARQKKTGSINIIHGESQELVLTTCDPKRRGWQLIILAKLLNIK